MAKAKARTASVKGPPPLPAVDQERPTPRPPALATERPTSRPAVIEEPPPTPRAPPVSARLESVDDEDEHTVMRPATAPLPRDAFRDDSATASQPLPSDAESSAGLPLELPVQAPSSPRKSRANFVWLVLAAAALGGGALVLVLQRQSPPLDNSAAAAGAPKSFTRTLPAPIPGRPRDEGTLDPPISTSFEANEAAPEEESVNSPTGVRRRPRPVVARPAQVTRPAAAVAAEQPAQPEAPASPSGTAPAGGNTPPEPARGAAAEPALNTATPTPSAAAPTPPAAPAAPPAAGSAPANAPANELPQGNVDTSNPYEE